MRIILQLAFAASLIVGTVESSSSPLSSCWTHGGSNNNDETSTACWRTMMLMKNRRGGASSMLATAVTSSMNLMLSPSSSNGYHSPNGIAEDVPPFCMNLHDLSWSLRWTCEMNRQLLHGSIGAPPASTHDETIDQSSSANMHPYNDKGSNSIRGGGAGGTAVHVHPTREWHPPIPSKQSQQPAQEELTIFHAKAPLSSSGSEQRRGVKRWGPDLLEYLRRVTTALGVSENPLVLALSVLYLDRACSVDTPRSMMSSYYGTTAAEAGSCPYVVPRTVHRLILTALLIATQAVYNSNNNNMGGGVDPEWLYTQIETHVGIPREEMAVMEQTMGQALGDEGAYVSPERLHHVQQVLSEARAAQQLASADREVQVQQSNGQSIPTPSAEEKAQDEVSASNPSIKIRPKQPQSSTTTTKVPQQSQPQVDEDQGGYQHHQHQQDTASTLAASASAM